MLATLEARLAKVIVFAVPAVEEVHLGAFWDDQRFNFREGNGGRTFDTGVTGPHNTNSRGKSPRPRSVVAAGDRIFELGKIFDLFDLGPIDTSVCASVPLKARIGRRLRLRKR